MEMKPGYWALIESVEQHAALRQTGRGGVRHEDLGNGKNRR